MYFKTFIYGWKQMELDKSIKLCVCVCLLMAKTECVGFPELIWR